MGKEPGICMVTKAWGSWVPPCRVGEGNGRLGGWAIGSLWTPDCPTELCHFCLGLWNHLLLFTYHLCQCIAEKLVQFQILLRGCKIRIPRPQKPASPGRSQVSVCYNSLLQSFMTGTHWSVGKATQGHPTSDHQAISCTDKLVLVYIASWGQSVFTLQMICVSKSCHPKLNSRKGRNIMVRVWYPKDGFLRVG